MLENTNNINYWNKIRKERHNENLLFIHIPKCAGSFVISCLKELNIKYKGHNRAEKGDPITFTVIRHPVERFESLINYRLSMYDKPRHDWPKSLYYVYNNKSISLNKIVAAMSDKDIMNFTPYNSLCYWSKNIDIFITIDKLEEFLSVFGYNINKKYFEKVNVSKKDRGTFNQLTKDRIAKLYLDDIILFKKVILD